MPLLLLIAYILVLFFLYKKNKDNIKKIPFLLTINGLIAFGLLIVFIVYYSEINTSIDKIKFSFYGLVLGFLITYIVYAVKYIKLYNNSEQKEEKSNNIGFLEKILNQSFYAILFFLAIVYFAYGEGFTSYGDDQMKVLLYIFIIFSSSFILFKNVFLKKI